MSTTEAPDTAASRSNALNVMQTAGFALAPKTFEEAWRIAQVLAKTSFAPPAMRGKPEDVLACLAMGQEVGLSPLQALQGIAVINGRPSLWGDAMSGVVRRDRSILSVKESFEGDVNAAVTATNLSAPLTVAPIDAAVFASCTVRRQREGEVEETTRTFSVQDAKIARLWMKKGERGDSSWVTYPQRMLQMRARSWALRDAASDLLKGLSSAEELIDAAPMKNVTPGIIEDTSEIDPRVTELAGKLKWTAARLELEMKTAGYDVEKLLEKMEAEQAHKRNPRPRAAVVVSDGETELAVPAMITKATNGALFASLAEIGVKDKPTRIAFAKDNGVEVESYSALTEEQGRRLIDAVHRVKAEADVAALRDAGRPVNETPEPCPACETAPGAPHFADCPEI